MKHATDLSYYLELQRRMLDIFRYVSCDERNSGTYSIMLESLLVESASFFESLCQTVVREERSSGRVFSRESDVDNFAEKVKGENHFYFTIRDYRLLLEPDFVLSQKEVNLNPHEKMLFVNPLSYHPDEVVGFLVKPFEEWAGANNSPLKWWNAFTELKHDRLANFGQSTLENTVRALAAAFVVLTVRHADRFKGGHVPAEIYDLFFPKYWRFHGRVMPGIVMWQ